MPDVILLGDINIDIIAAMPFYPARGIEGVATALEYHTGGGVVNTALTLANLQVGVTVGLIGRVGQDALAQQVTADLKKAGVDLSELQIDPSVSTGLIYVVVNLDGERTMFSARGANVLTERTKTLDDYFSDARWYHFSGHALLSEPQCSTAVYGLESARHHRCNISLDPGPEPAMRYHKQIKELLPKVDVFFPNEQELMFMTPGKSFTQAIEEVLETGCKAVVAKRGRQGCVIAYGQEMLEIPGFEVVAEDSTGAGDNFNAGVALGRMIGLSWPASAVLGNALGAIVCTKKGGSVGELSAKQVEGLIIQDQFKPQWRDWQPALEEVLAWLAV